VTSVQICSTGERDCEMGITLLYKRPTCLMEDVPSVVLVGQVGFGSKNSHSLAEKCTNSTVFPMPSSIIGLQRSRRLLFGFVSSLSILSGVTKTRPSLISKLLSGLKEHAIHSKIIKAFFELYSLYWDLIRSNIRR